MTVTTADIITQEAIREEVQAALEERLSFRRAYREFDATGISNDTVKLPYDNDAMAEPEEVNENQQFPRAEEEVKTKSATVVKYGTEVAISMESEEDSLFDHARIQTEKQARKMQEKLNLLAYNHLSSNLHTNSPAGNVGSTSDFEYEDVVNGIKELRGSGANPDLLVINHEAEEDLITSDDFTRATNFSDRVLREGPDVIGDIAGVDVVLDTDGHIGSGTAAGFLVDTENYGFEVMKGGVRTNEYEDDATQSRRFQIWVRVDHQNVDPTAAIKINA